MAVTFLGLTWGDDGFGYVFPGYAPLRAKIATYWADLVAVANLATNPGDYIGQFVDALAQVLDLAAQGDVDVVGRTLFISAQGVELDQLLQNVTERAQASPSRVLEAAYGTVGAAVPINTLVRTSPTGVAWALLTGGVIPAPPTRAYVVEVLPFTAGTYTGQFFTVTVAGTPASIQAQPGDDGAAVRDALVARINAPSLPISPTAYRLGTSPPGSVSAGRHRLLVIEESGGGPFALTSAGPVGQIFDYPAFVDLAEAQVAGPQVAANPGALVYGPTLANIQGFGNWQTATLGRPRETDSQLRARHQVTQRGLGGGNPDAIKAIVRASVDLGGGGANFCSVEYNPHDTVDPETGNVPHSIRVVVENTVGQGDVGLAIWKAKAAGDDTNGPVLVVIQDAEGGNQEVLLDFLEDVWFRVDIDYVIGEGWPNTGDPEGQLEQDVADFIDALQANNDVRVNELPISNNPDGTPRGVANFAVRLATGAAQGGPFGPFGPFWPTNPDATAASVALTGRQKARCFVGDVTAGP